MGGDNTTNRGMGGGRGGKRKKDTTNRREQGRKKWRGREGGLMDSTCTVQSSSMACSSSPVGAKESDVGGF